MDKFRIGQHIIWQAGLAAPREAYVLGRTKFDDYSQVLLLDSNGCEHRFNTSEWWMLNAGSKPDATVIKGHRGDFTHYALVVGKRMMITAGCRRFKTLKQAEKHWKGRRRRPWAYDRQNIAFVRNRRVKSYNRPYNVAERKRDLRLNKWSLAFTKKAERIRTGNR